MSELIRTCKHGHQYKGWCCNCDKCKTERKTRAASSRRSRARNGGGGRKVRRYASVGSFSWGNAIVIGPIHADACPKSTQDDPEFSGNYTRDEVDYMRHPD